MLDTAYLYGNSESVIGSLDSNQMSIVTKTGPLDKNSVEYYLEQSLKRLNRSTLEGLLIHDITDIFSSQGESHLASLMDLKQNGTISKIGISIYSKADLHRALSLFKPDIVQLPFSIIDQRLLQDNTLQSLVDSGIEVFARSIYLQGLLLIPPTELPPYFSPWRDLLAHWHSACQRIRMSPQHAALAFVSQCPYITRVVVGIQNASQLDDLLSIGDYKLPHNFSSVISSDPLLVNPSLWNV